MTSSFQVRTSCRLCSHPNLKLVVNLPATVSGNALKKTSSEDDPPLTPIDLYQCEKCGHVQVIHIPSPEFLYGKEYPFISSNNPDLVEHFKESIGFLTENFIASIDFALEIGSNDGTFLEELRKVTGCKVLGVDPSVPPVKIAKERGIETILNYFNEEIAYQVIENHGYADVAIANNVFAHIDDLRGFTNGIQLSLKEGGYFLFEASYLKDVIEKYLIGTIIHEHLSVHSLHSLIPFLKEFNLRLLAVKYVADIQGGAIVGVCQKVSPEELSLPLDTDILNLLEQEKISGITDTQGLLEFNSRLNDKASELKEKINSVANGKTIIGYGASVSSPIIIDLLGLRNKIKYIIDDNPFKKGKYMPIGNIPIVGFDEHRQPSEETIMIILGWAQTERILNKLKNSLSGCTVVTVYPEFALFEL